MKRYILYFIALTSFLALLFNVVEFFEKLVRSSSSSVSSIAYFSYLNFFATFSDLMPVGAWLSAVLVIREFVIRNEWEPILLLGINKRGFFRAIILACVLTMLGGLVADELFFRSMGVSAEQFRQTTFKKKRSDRIYNVWYRLDDKCFCFVREVDFYRAQGKGLEVFTLDKQFAIAKIVTADEFMLNNNKRTILIQKGSSVLIQDLFHKKILDGQEVDMSLLYGKIHLETQPFTLLGFMKYYAFDEAFLLGISRDLWILFIERILFYLQIVLLPLLAFIFFILFEKFLYARWCVLLLPYPLYTVISVFMSYFLTKKYYFCGILGLYLIVILCIVIMHRSWRSQDILSVSR